MSHFFAERITVIAMFNQSGMKFLIYFYNRLILKVKCDLFSADNRIFASFIMLNR